MVNMDTSRAMMHTARAISRDRSLVLFMGLLRDIMTAARLGKVVGHVAYPDTPVPVIVCAAFVEFLAPVTAGADPHA